TGDCVAIVHVARCERYVVAIPYYADANQCSSRLNHYNRCQAASLGFFATSLRFPTLMTASNSPQRIRAEILIVLAITFGISGVLGFLRLIYDLLDLAYIN